MLLLFFGVFLAGGLQKNEWVSLAAQHDLCVDSQSVAMSLSLWLRRGKQIQNRLVESRGGGGVLGGYRLGVLPAGAGADGGACCAFERVPSTIQAHANTNMQAQQKQDNQKFTTLKWHCLNPMAEVFSMPPQKLTTISERFAAMAPKKQVTPTKPAKPSQARMYVELQQHAANLAVEGFIASDPNFAASLKHLNGERTRHGSPTHPRGQQVCSLCRPNHR